MPVDSCAPARKRKLLILELWNLGDLVFLTSILPAALERFAVTLVGKPHASHLLKPTFPEVTFLDYDPPWTAYRDKYQFIRWNWRELRTLIRQMRAGTFDAVASVRSDPRDHLMMWLGGTPERYGFPAKGSGMLLNHSLQRFRTKQHRVEDWRDIGRALGLDGMEGAEPTLNHAAYHSNTIDQLFAALQKPVVCLHAGARISTRRWPERSFATLIENMRALYDFHLVLIPDSDGYGNALGPLAEALLPDVTLPEMVDLLGRADLLLCNDSGPAHIAAACGKPVIPVFGPSDPDWFHPLGNRENVVIRDICPWRPCFDYCKFNEPHCLTKLSSEIAWPDVRSNIERLISRGRLPAALRKSTVLDGQLP